MGRNTRYRLGSPVPAAAAAARTSVDRDRVIDGIRAGSLLVVVAGHCLMAVVAWPHGRPLVGNLLAVTPGTQAVTWPLQVMPLFFFAGGAANAHSWRRHREQGGRYPEWLWGRARRLLRPLWWYLALMGAVAAIVTAVASPGVAEPLLLLTTQLLWFLGAYLLVTAMTPGFCAVTLRGGLSGVAGLMMAAGLVDLARFALGLPAWIGLLNFVLVWSVPTFMGCLRTTGVLAHLGHAGIAVAAIIGLALDVGLVAVGPYPLSLVGMPGDPVSNMAPPTVVMALQSVVLTLVITRLDAPLKRLLQRATLWRRVTAVNLIAMTLYLWHLPVLVAVTTIAHAMHLERPVTMGADGFPQPAGWAYVWGTAAFSTAFIIMLWAVVRMLWPLEHAPLPWWDAPGRGRAPAGRIALPVIVTACIGVGVGTLMLSAAGLGGFPTRIVRYEGVPLSAAAAMALLLACGAALRWAGAPRLFIESRGSL